MPATPLVAHASGARARAGLIGNPDLIQTTIDDLNEATTLAAIDRANLSAAQRERIAVALLTDSVEAWLQRQLAAAPKNLTPEQRSKIARLLTGGDSA